MRTIIDLFAGCDQFVDPARQIRYRIDTFDIFGIDLVCRCHHDLGFLVVFDICGDHDRIAQIHLFGDRIQSGLVKRLRKTRDRRKREHFVLAVIDDLSLSALHIRINIRIQIDHAASKVGRMDRHLFPVGVDHLIDIVFEGNGHFELSAFALQLFGRHRLSIQFILNADRERKLLRRLSLIVYVVSFYVPCILFSVDDRFFVSLDVFDIVKIERFANMIDPVIIVQPARNDRILDRSVLVEHSIYSFCFR